MIVTIHVVCAKSLTSSFIIAPIKEYCVCQTQYLTFIVFYCLLIAKALLNHESNAWFSEYKKGAVPYRSLLFLCQFTLGITLKLHNQTADRPTKLNQLYQMQNPNRRINRFV